MMTLLDREITKESQSKHLNIMVIRALVTGANGSVGQGICIRLLEDFGLENIELYLICRSVEKGKDLQEQLFKKFKKKDNLELRNGK